MAVAETNVQNKISEQLKIVQSTQNVDTAFLDKTIRLDASQNLPPVCMLGEGPLVHNFAFRNARASQSHVKIVPDKQYAPNTTCQFQIECENGALLLPSTCDLCFTGILTIDSNWLHWISATPTRYYAHQFWSFDTSIINTGTSYKPNIFPHYVTNKNFFWADLFDSMRIYINDELVDELRSTEFEQYQFYQQTICPSSNGRAQNNYQSKMQDGFNRHNVSQNYFAAQHVLMRNPRTGFYPDSYDEMQQYVTWKVTCNLRFPHEIFRKSRCLPPGAVIRIDMMTSSQGKHYFFGGYEPLAINSGHENNTTTTTNYIAYAFSKTMAWTPFNFTPTEMNVYMDKLYCTDTVQIKSFLPFQSARDSYDFIIHNIRRSVVTVDKKFWWLYQNEEIYPAVVWPQKDPSNYVPSSSLIMNDLDPLDQLQRITLQTEGTAPPFYFVYATYEEKDRLGIFRTRYPYSSVPLAFGTAPSGNYWTPNTGCMFPVHTSQQSWDNERRMWNIPCFDIVGMTVRGATYEKDELEYTQSTPANELGVFIDRTYGLKRGNYTNELRTSSGFNDDIWRVEEAYRLKELVTHMRDFGTYILSNGSTIFGSAANHAIVSNKRWTPNATRPQLIDQQVNFATNAHCAQTISLQSSTYPQVWHMSHARTIRETMQLREGEVVVEWYWKPFEPTMGVPGCETSWTSTDIIPPSNVDARPNLEYHVTLNFVPINVRAVSFTPEGVKVKDLTEIELTEDGLDRIA